MKVLLVNPPFLKGFRKFNLNLPPIGLGYIGAMLEERGHEVKILDLSVEGWKEGELHSSDVVGVTSLTPTYPKAMEIAKRIKEKEPEVPLVLGGPHASFIDSSAFEFFDYAVRGEGEYTFPKLVERLEAGDSPESTRGITYREEGRVRHNPDRGFISNLDSLPFPARHLFNLKARGYMKMEGEFLAPAVSSRGCPFACSFCSTSQLTGLKWRARGPENVVREMEEIEGSYRAMAFVDDNFTLKPSRVEEICDETVERGLELKLKWGCMSRVDTVVKSPRMVEKMASAGCRVVYMGIESANQETLNSIKKRTNIGMIKSALNTLKNNNVEVIGSFVIGELEETRSMIKRTIDFAKELDLRLAQFSILTPLPGTEFWNRVKSRIVSANPELFDGLHSVVKTDHLEPGELEELLAKAYRSFYLSPRVMLRRLKYILKTGDLSELGQIWRFVKMKSSLE